MPRGDALTTIELLVLSEAGGDNTLANAYGAASSIEASNTRTS
jgi:hypothetical protein